MKKALTLVGLIVSMTGFAQTDTTGKQGPLEEQSDTIRVGTMIIIKKGGSKKDFEVVEDKTVKNRSYYQNRVHTDWILFDFGFANWADKTDYNLPETQAFLHDGGNIPLSSGDFGLFTGKSSNINIWLFMQRLSLYKGVVNLKYGFGMQMYNYFYKTNIVYVDGANVYVRRDTIDYNKNKLATDYFTVPVMLNFNTNPSRGNRALNFSVGVSAGYMYSSRQKLKVGNDKNKTKSNFNLDPWKVDYVAEVGLGIIHLYGSYNITTLHKTALKQYPYAVGIRIGGWD